MFSPKDFELPLEKQLKMRMIIDEVNQCKDVEALQENLIACATTLQKYQHLLSVTLEKQLTSELEAFSKKVTEHINATTDIFD